VSKVAKNQKNKLADSPIEKKKHISYSHIINLFKIEIKNKQTNEKFPLHYKKTNF
jgi:hypothetical protein